MNAEIIAPFLIETLAKSVLILSVAALIDRAWVRASAAQRHLVWCAAFAAVLLLPLTRVFEPRWNVALQRVSVELPQGRPVELPVLASALTHNFTAPHAPAPPRWQWPDWQHTTFFIWSAGAVLLLLTRLLGSIRLIVLRRTTHPLLDARVQQLAAETCRELGIRRRVELRLSPMGCVPLTWGTLRPVLLLPAEALAWSEARLTAALRHEAGHIARGDHFTRWIAYLACALYWPNPLAWLAARHLRTAQEQATDDLVLRAGSAPDEYAAQLFEVARTLAARRGLAQCAVAMTHPSTLERRMLAIVDEQCDRRPLTLRALAGGVLAVALTFGLATAAQLRGAEPVPPPAVEAPGVPATKPKERQVEIHAKFVEMPLESDAAVGWNQFETVPPGGQTEGVFSDPQFQVVIRALSQKKGVDLLSAPRITTKSKQPAVVEVIREFRYPTDFEKGTDDVWKPTEFGVKNVGVTLEVRPDIKADGSIELILKPSVVEFLGFVDLDTGKSVAATRDKSKPGAVADLTPLQPVSRLKSIFSERKIETTVTLQDGYTVALSGMKETAELKPFEKAAPKRKLIVFVSARIIDPMGKVEGTAQTITTDTKTGTMKSEGEVKIETADATVRAKEAAIQPKQITPAESAVLAKARKIILPKIELRAATVAEAVDFLRQKAREFDEEKEGVATPDALVLEPPVGGAASVTGKSPADLRADGVAITLSAKKAFKGNDGIEIREVSGSLPTFRVGGTYRVQGVCRQDTIRNASLYLGNTAEGSRDAIKPSSGTSLFKDAPRGLTEFEFAFTLLRPGKLYVTIYDLDNYDPKDNAYAGVYLGDVSP